MPKRFIDTGLFEDEWFMDLSKDGKILWIYFITKCNHAGIIQLNMKMFTLQTGIKEFSTVIKELGNHCITLKPHTFFIPKFIVFQYPGFPNSNVKQQTSAVSELERYNLFSNGKINLDSYLTLNEDLNKTKKTVLDSYVYENGNVIIKEQKKHLFRNDVFSDFEKFKLQFEKSDFADADFKYYFDSFMDWSNSKGEQKIDWIATVRNGMRKDKQNGKYKTGVNSFSKNNAGKNSNYGQFVLNTDFVDDRVR